MNIPPSFCNRIKVYIDLEQQHIHILDLVDKNLSQHQLKRLIAKLSQSSTLPLVYWNWIYYGTGQAFGVGKGVLGPLSKKDKRLYWPFKERMLFSAPYRAF